MSNNEFVLAAIKGEPNSLTSIAFHTGEIMERQRLLKLLKELGVIRDSMLGDEWKVIYTEHGAKDITLDKLEARE
jgi:hypothetical protein